MHTLVQIKSRKIIGLIIIWGNTTNSGFSFSEIELLQLWLLQSPEAHAKVYSNN